MKSLFLILLAINIHLTSFSQSDSSTTKKSKPERFALDYKNALKFDARFFIGNFTVSYERFLNRSNSISAIGRYYNYLYSGSKESYNASFYIQYRHYFAKRDKRGFYLGLNTGLGSSTIVATRSTFDSNGSLIDKSESNRDFRFASIGMPIGYQLLIDNRWNVDIGVQINYNYWIARKYEGYDTNYKSDSEAYTYIFYFNPFLTLNLGYYF